MDWPLSSDFSRMLQNPKVAFRDRGLRAVRIEMDNLGQPKPRSGNFATVYRGYRTDNSEMAVRVFNRRADLRREAYQAKSEYLSQNHVFSLVNFQYDEKGIRASDGRLYPLLTMDWVPGVTLFEWVRDRCREGYQEALSIAADVWLQVVHELANNQIVHGDLQHGNVLVDSQGHFKLVDYDCMAVPKLFGQRNFEIGMEPYQHPARNESTTMFLGLDNFSALVIYVALRALAATPQLWLAFVDQTGYDKLLFRKEDIASPQTSTLYQQLLASPDLQVRDLTYYLCQLATYKLEDVPSVDEVILWCHSVEDLLGQRDWDRAVQLVERMGPDEQIADHLQPAIERAKQRVDCRKAVEDAYHVGDERQVSRLYNANLLADYPAAEELSQRAGRAAEVARVIENLNTANRFQRWSVIVELWDNNRELIEDRPSMQIWKEEIVKIRAAETVRRLLDAKIPDDERVLDAWKYFKSLGGHVAGDEHWPQVQDRIDRQNRIERLRGQLGRSSEVPTISTDRKVVAAFKSSGLDNRSGAADLAAVYLAAKKRLSATKQLQKIVAGDITLEREKQIIEYGANIPENYHEKLTKRIRIARGRVKTHAALSRALKSPRSDVAIFEAYKELSAAKGKMLISDKVRGRVKLAARRMPVLKEINRLNDDIPAYEVDEKLIECWDNQLLDKCRDADPWRERHEIAQERRKVLEDIKKVIEEFDQQALAKLVHHECLQGFEYPEPIRRGLLAVKQRVEENRNQQRQGLAKSLVGKQRRLFADLYETDLVADICRENSRHHQLVAQWMGEVVLPTDICGLAPARDEDILEPIEAGQLKIRWTWPTEKITDRCLLAVCKDKLSGHARPEEVEQLYSVPLHREQWETDERCHKLGVQEDWEQAYVIVWAVVDLGFEEFYSPPLVLGQIPVAKKMRSWSLFKKGQKSAEEST
ncbi:MAG: AarF/UbiB family protein [Pirellulales bacterium]